MHKVLHLCCVVCCYFLKPSYSAKKLFLNFLKSIVHYVKEPANATEFLRNSFYYVYNWKNIAYCQGAVATFLLGVLLNKIKNKIKL